MIKTLPLILYSFLAVSIATLPGNKPALKKPSPAAIMPAASPVVSKTPVNKEIFEIDLKEAGTSRFYADIANGNIGDKNEWHTDRAYDNIFHVRLKRLPGAGEIVSMHYRLKGAASNAGISRSINDGQATGGYFTQPGDKWTEQQEFVSPALLHRGDNVIRFGLPENAAFNYQVGDLYWSIEKKQVANAIVVNTANSTVVGQKAYCAGVLTAPGILYCDGKPLKVYNGEFEFMAQNPSGTNTPFTVQLKLVTPKGRIFSRMVSFVKPNSLVGYTTPAEKGISNSARYNKSTGLFLSLNYNGAQASVEIPRGATLAAAPVSITALRTEDLPPIGTDMVNLTRGAKGYRFLPHGSKFLKPAHIKLPVDTALLPEGYAITDVRTFYFDEQTRVWIELAHDKDKMPPGVSGALTTHFTDMISGIIKVPESPQTQGYTPTSIKDYKAADPSAGIEMIAPPTANAMGNAALSFPIKLPQGRLGMQPGLNLQYNSEGGNSWLGLGWNLSIPAIDIDTRWGVPRYSNDLETETYTMSGEQLAPLANRTDFVPRLADRRFHARIEGAFQKIIRHGSNPKNYWWEVTNKNGVRSFYGGTPGGGVNADAVLKDDDGNIARWPLLETRDLHNNFVRYSYTKVYNPQVSGGVGGSQIYISKITYTGNGTNEGRYSVAFDREDDIRTDVEINARLGFKIVTAARLTTITVKLDDKKIRKYVLDYATGEFYKTLLKGIRVLDSKDNLFYGHEFNYFDDVKNDAGAALLSDPIDWNPANDHIKGDLINPLPGFTDESSVLSTLKSKQAGAQLVVTVGLVTPSIKGVFTKENTIGGGVGYEGGSNEGLVTMIDINGDGLPDKVFKKNGALFYRPNLGKDGHGFGDIHPISGIGNFSRGNSRTIKTNLQALPFGAFIGYERSTTTNTTTEYFADFNGDGLPDLASNGQVFFNHLDDNHNPVFELTSTATPSPITSTGSINQQFLMVDPAEQQMQEDNFPLQDAVRFWRAPYAGRISIIAPVQLLPSGAAGIADPREDGVNVSIQTPHGNLPWATDILNGDHTVKTPVNVNYIDVAPGDRIYFRVRSRFNGNNDAVKWDPIINYQNVTPAVDANNRSTVRYKASEDFVLDNKAGTLMIKDGNITIGGSFFKYATSDSVNLLVARTDSNGNRSVIKEWRFGSKETSPDLEALKDIKVAKGDTLRFYVRSPTYIDRTAVEWTPSYSYTYFSDGSPFLNTNGLPVLTASIVPDNANYNNWLLKGQSFTWPQADDMVVKALLNGQTKATGKITFSVKGTDTVYARQTLQLNAGFIVNVPADIKLKLIPNKPYYFEYTTTDTVLAANLKSAKVALKIDSAYNPGTGIIFKNIQQTVNANLYSDPPQAFMGALFRGWGQFSYKGEKYGTAPLNEAKLNLDQYQSYQKDPSGYTDPASLDGLQNPATAEFVVMTADPVRHLWAGLDSSVYVAPATISSSRLFLHDVAVEKLMAGASLQAADKINASTNKSYSASFYFGGSYSTATSITKLDMMDMNGDRYPDVLNQDNIQYTRPGGELGAEITEHGLGGTSGKGDTKGISLGGDFLKGLGLSSRSIQATVSIQNAEATIGLSGSASSNEQETNATWIDVNGDGLPDKVYKNGEVRLNYGYKFGQPEQWGIARIDKNSSITASGGVGFNITGGSFEGGFSLNRTAGSGAFVLADINGDGLLDQVYEDGVQINSGNIFQPKMDWSSLKNFSNNVSTGESIQFAYTHAILIAIPFIGGIKICINPSVTAGHGVSREQDQIMDIDGDGLPDVLHSENDGNLQVRRSLIGRTNMLKDVSRPMGGSFTMDYERVGNTYLMPQNKWVLKTVEVFDGVTGDGADITSNTFTYRNGRYNRREREFYGFDTVITNQLNTADRNLVYRSTVQEYVNTSYYTKGLIAREWLQDAAGHKFTETTNQYILQDVDNNVVFPALDLQTKLFYEGKSNPGASTGTSYKYDALGNLIRIYDQGDGNAKDILQADITYQNDDIRYIKAIPASINVTTTDGVKRSRETKINSFGDIIQIKQNLADGTASVYDMVYNTENGNLTRVTRPANSKGQRMFYKYAYDKTVNSYVENITDAYGYSSSCKYDYSFGIKISDTSINREPMRTTIDNRGRIISVTGPYELAKDSTLHTIEFEYLPHITATDPLSYAITRHYDPQYDTTGVYDRKNDINTITFMDGLGRALQVKKQISLFTGKGKQDELKMVVSGHVDYDAFGRATKSYYPVTEALSATNNTLNQTLGNTLSSALFDVLDRPSTEVLADGTTSKMAYTIDKGFLITTATDALKNVRETVTDVRGRKREDHALSGPAGVINTKFSYNALSELTEVEDNGGNKLFYTYDNLGRKTSSQNPDGGLTTFVYDPAGNLTQKVTAQLRKKVPNGGAINYLYDFERLTGIDYQIHYENKVTYVYGPPASGESPVEDDRAGRLILQEDASGGQEFYYGKLGEVIKQIRTVMVSPIFFTTYISDQKYDTWNRLTQMTYADGEKVTYHYNHGGNLVSVRGTKENLPYSYVDQLGYDEYDQRVYLRYGNGTETHYAYDKERRRLSNLSTTTLAGRFIMNNTYGYDAVSNILNITNTARADSGKLGGPSAQNYRYDKLYRLVSANGNFNGFKDTAKYNLEMGYDNLYNITTKKMKTLKPAESYNYQYNYAGGPHQLSSIGDNKYSYDLNGNLEVNKNERTDKTRELFWDEENRLVSVIDSTGLQSQYTYDGAGERVVKSSGGLQGTWVNGAPAGTVNHHDNYTAYVSPYLVATRLAFTKYFYIESQRIAAKIGNGRFTNISFPLTPLTAGNVNYVDRAKQIQRDRIKYYSNVPISPGTPTQKNFFGEPQNSGIAAPVLVDSTYAVPRGWPGNTTPPADGPPVYTTQLPASNFDVPAGYGFKDDSKDKLETNRYFYHSDHLGSTSFVTDATGEASQHVEYSAFGESYYTKNLSTFDNPYRFNSKELDTETGLYYYGARYYNPQQSQWLSVDPMVDKYPGLSPYNYTLNNPVRMIDPDGKLAEYIGESIGDFLLDTKDQVKDIYSRTSLYSNAKLSISDGFRYAAEMGAGDIDINWKSLTLASYESTIDSRGGSEPPEIKHISSTEREETRGIGGSYLGFGGSIEKSEIINNEKIIKTTVESKVSMYFIIQRGTKIITENGRVTQEDTWSLGKSGAHGILLGGSASVEAGVKFRTDITPKPVPPKVPIYQSTPNWQAGYPGWQGAYVGNPIGLKP